MGRGIYTIPEYQMVRHKISRGLVACAVATMLSSAAFAQQPPAAGAPAATPPTSTKPVSPATPVTPAAPVASMGDCTGTADRAKAITACGALIKDAGRDMAKLSAAYAARAAQYAATCKPRDALADYSRALSTDPKNAAL